MKNLPLEVLKNIFALCHQEDRVECMTVCHEWARIVETFCLFHTVILRSEHILEQLIGKFEETPEFGTQVEYLVIEINYGDSYQLEELLPLLPNLRYLYVCPWNTILSDSQSQVQQWTHRIRQLEIHNNAIWINELLSANNFHRLKRLYLDDPFFYDPKAFNVLSNIQSLSELKLHNARDLTLEFMESIHTTLPLLKSLTIVDIMFMQCPTIQNIQPVTMLQKLHLVTQLTPSKDTRLAWLRYMAKKYPNLSSLNMPFLDDKLLEGKDDDGNVINQTQIYQALFNNCGPRLKHLGLTNSTIPFNLFEILDKSGCTLKHLKLNTYTNNTAVGRMPFTVQSYNIESLEIQYKATKRMKWITVMPSLKHLVLSCNNLTIEFEHVLKLCSGTIETLEINNMVIDIKNTPSTPPCKLKSLKLSKCKIPNDFDAFISKYLPNISTLKMIFCPYPKETLSVPNLQLFHFEYLDYKFRHRNKVLVNTLENKESRLYISGYRYRDSVKDRYHNNTPSLYPPSKCTAPGDTPDLTVECATVKNVIV
jgi:hypothetical protein